MAQAAARQARAPWRGGGTKLYAPCWPSAVPQVYVLGGRMLRMWWRNPAMLVSESAQYAFMAVFVGLVYLQ